jgi:histone-lysine N-methyltransferase SETMAR
MRRKRPEEWHTNKQVLHYDNTQLCTAYIVQEFLAKSKMAVVPDPPYSPDLAPSNLFLFTKMKIKFKGRRFDKLRKFKWKHPNI